MTPIRTTPVRTAFARIAFARTARPAFPPLTSRRAARLMADDTGSATAEYAIATMAAVAFAGLLVVIMRSDEVRGILEDLVRRALTVA